SYSKLIHGLKQSDIELDRKVLANLAIVDPNAFTEVVKAAGIPTA
ncbi:MAG: 50S ribosomal protein L20, partial [Deltaproteobacteria bacterium]|nr:50S ribosomal protein L20 [Deltaproteobacteria bacterium]